MNGARGEPRRGGVRGHLVVVAGAALAGTILIALAQGWRPASEQDSRVEHSLTRPLRLECTTPGAFREFLLGLRVHHYRPQPQGEATYHDIFLDTVDRALSRNGYSYRFRTKLQGGGGGRYSIRLNQESRRIPGESKRLDIVSDLSDGLGEAIAAGAWPQVVALDSDQTAAESVRAILHGLGIEARSLEPQLAAELRRERFEITDKGRSWFTLDHEIWIFRAFGASATAGSVRCEDIVVDTTLSRDDLELVRRVRTMEMLAKMVYGVRPSASSPYERAIEALAAVRAETAGIPVR